MKDSLKRKRLYTTDARWALTHLYNRLSSNLANRIQRDRASRILILMNVASQSLWRATHATFGEWIEEVLGVARSSAYMYLKYIRFLTEHSVPIDQIVSVLSEKPSAIAYLVSEMERRKNEEDTTQIADKMLSGTVSQSTSTQAKSDGKNGVPEEQTVREIVNDLVSIPKRDAVRHVKEVLNGSTTFCVDIYYDEPTATLYIKLMHNHPYGMEEENIHIKCSELAARFMTERIKKNVRIGDNFSTRKIGG